MLEKDLNRKLGEATRYVGVEVGGINTMEASFNDISIFSSHVNRVSFFSDDEGDEFSVIREDGRRQGIFKTWAVPAIPFLDSKSLPLFNQTLSQTTNLKEDIESIDPLRKVFEKWAETNSDQPGRYFESLERWRTFSQIYDKRLTRYFQEKSLPDDPEERVAELFLRLFVAFQVSSPFYNLEAVVGDVNNSRYNPSSKDKNGVPSGGSLDVTGMLLPSALPALVSAGRLDWNGLNWDQIRENLSNAESEELKTVFRISKELDVSPEDVVFAANVLEWIPVNVGGKKGDVKSDDARRMIMESLGASKISSTDGVSRNVNALIRFLNWFPLIKNSKNFECVGWRYAAVCDTSSQLVEEVQRGSFFEGDFDETFLQTISPQIKNVDATSAKGRLMIQLLVEKRFNRRIYELISARSKEFDREIINRLAEDKKHEYVVDIYDHQPRAIVGGKTAGLREAGIIFGRENVVQGCAITSEAINDWLRSDKNLWNSILELDGTSDVKKKIETAWIIESKIKMLQFPIESTTGLFDAEFGSAIARSSSFDEDSDITGSAAGIYESIPCLSREALPEVVSQVVSSFFSEKAVSFRSLNGLSDLPMFAVLLNPMIEGHGGIAFSLGKDDGWEVVTGRTPSDVADNHSEGFDSFKFSQGVLNKVNNNGWIDESIVVRVGEMVKKAEDFLGLKVDVEFVVDSHNKIWILQLRTLHDRQTLKTEDKKGDVIKVTIDKLEDLDLLEVGHSVGLSLDIGSQIDLNQFQGTFFRWLVVNRDSVKEISLSKRIPRTGHFANICLQLGIKLNFTNVK